MDNVKTEALVEVFRKRHRPFAIAWLDLPVVSAKETLTNALHHHASMPKDAPIIMEDTAVSANLVGRANIVTRT